MSHAIFMKSTADNFSKNAGSKMSRYLRARERSLEINFLIPIGTGQKMLFSDLLFRNVILRFHEGFTYASALGLFSAAKRGPLGWRGSRQEPIELFLRICK